MSGRPDRKEESAKKAKGGATRGEKRVARNASSKAYMSLATAVATVCSAGVYTREELQAAVCTFVSEMKDGGETAEGVTKAAQGLVAEVGIRFPSSERTQMLLADLVTWCLAEYYRETA